MSSVVDELGQVEAIAMLPSVLSGETRFDGSRGGRLSSRRLHADAAHHVEALNSAAAIPRTTDPPGTTDPIRRCRPCCGLVVQLIRPSGGSDVTIFRRRAPDTDVSHLARYGASAGTAARCSSASTTAATACRETCPLAQSLATSCSTFGPRSSRAPAAAPCHGRRDRVRRVEEPVQERPGALRAAVAQLVHRAGRRPVKGVRGLVVAVLAVEVFDRCAYARTYAPSSKGSSRSAGSSTKKGWT